MEPWNDRYVSGDLPWDTGDVDPHLVELTAEGIITPCRVLDVGCGTGTNARWLAERGFEVHGVDLSPRAIEMAKAKCDAAGLRIPFTALDFLHDDVPGGPFDLVFDRGVFHVFDEADDRARFAAQVTRCLAPGGHWVSLIGSTEGPPREEGPPRRSARDIAQAIEPVLEIAELRTTVFDLGQTTEPRAWFSIARPRLVAAQPSTRRE